jgi:hypothetical protein
MANLATNQWSETREGKLLGLRCHILFAPINTTTIDARIGKRGAVPAPWAEYFVSDGNGVTMSESDAEIIKREVGYNMRVDKRWIKKVGEPEVTIPVAEAGLYFLENMSGIPPTDVGTPKVGERIKQYLSEGDRKAVTLIFQSEPTGTEIHKYNKNVFITYKAISPDPNSLVAEVRLYPDVYEDTDQSNKLYPWIVTVLPDLTANPTYFS